MRSYDDHVCDLRRCLIDSDGQESAALHVVAERLQTVRDEMLARGELEQVDGRLHVTEFVPHPCPENPEKTRLCLSGLTVDVDYADHALWQYRGEHVNGARYFDVEDLQRDMRLVFAWLQRGASLRDVVAIELE